MTKLIENGGGKPHASREKREQRREKREKRKEKEERVVEVEVEKEGRKRTGWTVSVSRCVEESQAARPETRTERKPDRRGSSIPGVKLSS